ncbi:phage tail protein [Maricurvus nonylphenolicus]|uniref:phage tail protein n=1 Tax=Maricurvus nonylphenolicus TaxID=1008307 RepID=UPI0036F43CE5
MLMTLGLFVFTLQTAPLNGVQRQASWKHKSNPRVGQRDANQYLGPGDEYVTLPGVLAPEITGGPSNLEELRTMAGTGDAWLLIDATGAVWGQYIIESIDDKRTRPLPTGEARKIEFSIKLKRVDSDRLEQLGDINASYARFIA